MRSIVGNVLTHVPKIMRRAERHLRPLIEFRLKQYELNGEDWPDKPVSCFERLPRILYL